MPRAPPRGGAREGGGRLVAGARCAGRCFSIAACNTPRSSAARAWGPSKPHSRATPEASALVGAAREERADAVEEAVLEAASQRDTVDAGVAKHLWVGAETAGGASRPGRLADLPKRVHEARAVAHAEMWAEQRVVWAATATRAVPARPSK